jgi:hypothetical protein
MSDSAHFNCSKFLVPSETPVTKQARKPTLDAPKGFTNKSIMAAERRIRIPRLQKVHDQKLEEGLGSSHGLAGSSHLPYPAVPFSASLSGDLIKFEGAV